jgi:hypothetical protein
MQMEAGIMVLLFRLLMAAGKALWETIGLFHYLRSTAFSKLKVLGQSLYQLVILLQ